MKLSHLMTVALAGVAVLFVSGAESSTHFQVPMFSPLLLQAGLNCGLVNGQFVCGNTKSSGKHHDDNDDDGKDKKKNTDDDKNSDDDTGLTDCTIQQPGGGGGCTGGFKRVCEKLKNGKKCCGCMVDKNAPPPKKADDKPQLLTYACTSNVQIPDGTIVDNRKACLKAASDEEARIIYMSRLGQGVTLVGPVTCTQNNADH